MHFLTKLFVILVSLLDTNSIFKGVLIIFILMLSKLIMNRYPHFVTKNLEKSESVKHLILQSFILLKIAEFSLKDESFTQLQILSELIQIALIFMKMLYIFLLILVFIIFKTRQKPFFKKIISFSFVNKIFIGFLFLI